MAVRNSVKPASEIMPPPARINSLQALTRLKPKKGSEWGVFAFVLNKDMIQKDGSLDELYGVTFQLGAFDEQEKAEKHAKSIIELTGHTGVIAAKYGMAVPLTTKFDPSTVTEVTVDARGKIMELESAEYKQQNEEYEKRMKLEKDLIKEAEEETDLDSIEYFKRQCYLAIKTRAKFQFHTREADTAWQEYKKHEGLVRDHHVRHPEHEKDWLPYLKKKLIERGESNLFIAIENAYKEIRDEILGLIDEDDNCLDGVCINPNVNQPKESETIGSADEIISADEVKIIDDVKVVDELISADEVKIVDDVKMVDELVSADEVKIIDELISADEVKVVDEIISADEVKVIDEIKVVNDDKSIET